MQPLTLADVQTVTGAAILVALVVEIVKRAGAWSPATVDRFGPAFAAALGIVVVIAATVAGGGHDFAQAALTGLLGGASAMGLSDVVGSLGKPATPAPADPSSAPGEAGYQP